NGKQYMSWIMLDDLIELYRFCLTNVSITGVLNATAPNPVTNREFTKLLAYALKKPAISIVPEFVLRLIFGEMADGTVLGSQNVIPHAALTSGFEFKYEKLEQAFRAIFETS
ncbi:DUF1731 domain-containing protein, partial [Calditrichota bacterium]